MQDSVQSGTGIITATLRYWWVVVASLGFALLLVLVSAQSQSRVYEATASLIVREVPLSVEEGDSALDPERNAADHIAILSSGPVIERSGRLLQKALKEAGIAAEPSGLFEVIGSASNLVTVRYTDPNARVAQLGANSVVLAYQDVLGSVLARSAGTALEQVDASISRYERNLREIADRLEDLGGRAELARDLDMLGAAGQILDRGSDNSIQRAIARSIQDALLERRAELAVRRTELAVEAGEETGTDAVGFFAPASLPSDPIGAGLFNRALVAVFLGGLAGISLAYLLASLRTGFADSAGPGNILNAPNVASVRSLANGDRTQLTARDASDARSEPMFGLAAPLLHARLSSKGVRSLAMVSAEQAVGKSVVAANVGLSAARAGMSVILVDADFRAPALSRLLLGDDPPRVGLKEVADGDADLHDAVSRPQADGAPTPAVLTPGQRPAELLRFFEEEGTRRLLERLKHSYDLVIIDPPGVLQVAYVASLLRSVDAALVVVPHRSDPQSLNKLTELLALLDAPIFGYVYSYHHANGRGGLAGHDGAITGRVRQRFRTRAPAPPRARA